MSKGGIDIFDEEKISKLLHVQKLRSIDFERDLDWESPIDLSLPLLPLDQNALIFPNANVEERLVISQFMGLIVASTISELENIAFEMKDATWHNILNKYPVNPEIIELGEHFYEDERSHSMAFNRYIAKYAEALNIDTDDLRKYLPSGDKSLSAKIYRLNSYSGGMAIWWLIAALEEESILIFNHMRNFKDQLEPLHFNLHRCHFEEETRHKSYAYIMLKINQEFRNSPMSRIFRKIDFLIAETLNAGWSLKQLLKIRNFKKLETHHPFFKILNKLSNELSHQNSAHVMGTLFNRAPYISEAMAMSQHKHISYMRKQFGALRLPTRAHPCHSHLELPMVFKCTA